MSTPKHTPTLPHQPIRRRTTAEHIAIAADQLTWKATDSWPIFSFIVEWRERRYARQQAAALVASYRRLKVADPSLTGERLYEQVIIARLGCTPSQARDVIRGADVSFAQWPEERDVNFRDVVNYLVTHELMAAHDRRLGTRADMVELFKEIVPGNF